MNKKLESAMNACAENEWLNPDSDIDWKGIVGHDFTASFNLGFQKCHELMQSAYDLLEKKVRSSEAQFFGCCPQCEPIMCCAGYECGCLGVPVDFRATEKCSARECQPKRFRVLIEALEIIAFRSNNHGPDLKETAIQVLKDLEIEKGEK